MLIHTDAKINPPHHIQHNMESASKDEHVAKRLSAINYRLLLASILNHVTVQFNQMQLCYCHLE